MLERGYRLPSHRAPSGLLPGSLGVVLLTLLTTLGAPLPATAQEYGFGATRATSGNTELPDPTGVFVRGVFEFRPGWSLDFSVERIAAETVADRRVCRGFNPPVTCSVEETRNEVRLTGLRAAALRTLVAGERGRLGVGAGFSMNRLGVSSRGTSSGHQGDVFEPTGGQAGVLGFLSARLVPFPALGLRLTARTTVHWVGFNACSETRYDPFCDPATFHELQVGLAWSLPSAG